MKEIIANIIVTLLAIGVIAFMGGVIGYFKGYRDGIDFIKMLHEKRDCENTTYESFRDIPTDCYKYLEIE